MLIPANESFGHGPEAKVVTVMFVDGTGSDPSVGADKS